MLWIKCVTNLFGRSVFWTELLWDTQSMVGNKYSFFPIHFLLYVFINLSGYFCKSSQGSFHFWRYCYIPSIVCNCTSPFIFLCNGSNILASCVSPQIARCLLHTRYIAIELCWCGYYSGNRARGFLYNILLSRCLCWSMQLTAHTSLLNTTRQLISLITSQSTSSVSFGNSFHVLHS